MSKLAILGAGSWGTALAIVLAPRFSRVALWGHDVERVRRMADARENLDYLPGFRLAENVEPTGSLDDALEQAEILLGVMPSAHARATYRQIRTQLPVVSATKGLERGSLKRMSEVIAESTGTGRVAVLSGPTFAREIAAGQPAAVAISAQDPLLAHHIQLAFRTPLFRPYTNTDPVGAFRGDVRTTFDGGCVFD